MCANDYVCHTYHYNVCIYWPYEFIPYLMFSPASNVSFIRRLSDKQCGETTHHLQCIVTPHMKAALSVAGCCGCLSVCVSVSADCPGVTPEGLRHLGSLSGLVYLYLRDLPAGVLTDAVMASLQGCSRLEELYLGHWDRPLQTDIPVAAVTRSVRLLTTQPAVHPHPEQTYRHSRAQTVIPIYRRS